MRAPVTLRRQKKQLDLKAFKQRKAEETDYTDLITRSTLIYDTDAEKVAVVYLELEEDCRPVIDALQQINYETNVRTSGMISTSKVFGFLPRNPIRRDYCTSSALARQNPEAHATVASYAERVARYYEQFNPELYKDHQQTVEAVLPDWRIDRGVFTSGIINKNNPLPYHFDAGNFRDVWSNMLVFKKDIAGGYLSVPEYDCGFELKDNSLLMFDGQNLVHGVTPIYTLTPDAHRYSIVFYSLQQMWNCLPIDDEVIRIQELRTERERKRRMREKAERAAVKHAE